MKKIILLLISLFLITGCTVDYNLTVGDKISEDVTASEYDMDYALDEANGKSEASFYEEYLNEPIPLLNTTVIESDFNKKQKNVDYYKVKDNSDEDSYILNFNGVFNKKDYNNSSLAVFANSTFKGSYKNDVLTITSGKKMQIFERFPYLEQINIKIKVDKGKVKENNADRVNNNTYTWIITRDNYLKKNLKIVIDQSNIFSGISNLNDDIYINKFNLQLLISMLILVLIIFLIYKILENKFKNKDKL